MLHVVSTKKEHNQSISPPLNTIDALLLVCILSLSLLYTHHVCTQDITPIDSNYQALKRVLPIATITLFHSSRYECDSTGHYPVRITRANSP